MANVYPRLNCEALKLTWQNTDEGNISVQYKTINNGVVLELHKYLKSDSMYHKCYTEFMHKLNRNKSTDQKLVDHQLSEQLSIGESAMDLPT